MSMTKNLLVKIIKPTNVTWEVAGNMLRTVDRETTLAANRAMQALWEADAAARALTKVENGQVVLPKNNGKLDLPKIGISQNDVYHILRNLVPDMNSSISAVISKNVWDHYRTKRLAVLSLRERMPGYTSFGIRTSNYTLTHLIETKNGKQYDNFVLSIGLLSKTGASTDQPTRVDFVLETHWLTGERRKALIALCSFCAQRPCKTPVIISVKYKKDNKSWTVHIPYDVECKSDDSLVEGRELDVCVDPENLCSIKMSCQTSPEVTQKTDIRVRRLDTSDFGKTLASLYKQSRLRSRRYRDAQLGEAIRGHGRPRAIRSKEPLWKRRRNFNLKKNQNLTLAIVKQALEWKCSTIFWQKPKNLPTVEIEAKWVYSWPWFEFESWLKNRCQEYGVKFTTPSDDLETEVKKLKKKRRSAVDSESQKRYDTVQQ